jgi:hypothetical protein
MSLLVILYSAILFFILSPGVFLRFPKNGDKFTVAGVHAAVFALVFGLTHKFVAKLGARLRLEGFDAGSVLLGSKPSPK